MTQKITNITRRDVINILVKGTDYFESVPLSRINYWGNLDIVSFLSRLFPIDNMPSYDNRYENAGIEIHVHCVAHDDYPIDFIFTDDRFNLASGNDENFLNFLCQVFHPEVRDENSSWHRILTVINELLLADGFEIYKSSQISGRDVYSWKEIIKKENYMPFSLRNKDVIKSKQLTFRIPKSLRETIYNILTKYNFSVDATSETGFNYNYPVTDEIFIRLKDFYQPKCYNEANKYAETNMLKDFILHTSPYCVFDALEVYSQIINSIEYENQINLTFRQASLPYSLNNGMIIGIVENALIDNSELSEEEGVSKLMQSAIDFYNQGNKAIAVEKLWDAFERLKTLLPGKKKDAATSMINKMGHGEQAYIDLYTTESKSLTDIGNNFRIRHHETDRVNITSHLDYDYLFHRCWAFVNLAVKHLNHGQ